MEGGVRTEVVLGDGQMSRVLSFHARWLVRSYTLHMEVKNMRVETGYESKDSLDSGVLQLDFSDKEEFVINTKDACEADLVGGKAFHISELARKGFAVPEGFCITTEAYDYFMHSNGISGEDEDVGDKIRGGLMPPFLLKIIRGAYHMYLHDKPCAVRSSSPAEDLKNASFAGQYRSFLNVTDEDALIDAVKECWASLWSRTAKEYRKKMGIGEEDVKMAVLVQEMLPATASGVLFTEDTVIIEAVWGLGDILVGGMVVPDHFEIDKEAFKVKERKISHKDVISQISSKGGVEKTEVPEHLRDRPVLKDADLRKLCALGKEVEDIFGCPQDIEWILYNSEFVLLQARPITVKQMPTIYSRANIAETMPGYVTYLSRTPENKPDFLVLGLLPFLECFGIKDIPENLRIQEYFYGHIYADMTTAYNIVQRIPISSEMLDQSLGNLVEEEGRESKLGLFDIAKIIPGAFRVIRLFLNLPAQAEEVIPHSEELIGDIRHRDLQTMSLSELGSLVWEMYDRNLQVLQVHECGLLAIISLFDFIHKILKRIGEEDAEKLLTMGLEGMSSRQIGVDMWKLAQSAMKSPSVTDIILSQRNDFSEELTQFQEGRDFLKNLDRFIEKFGDRCSQELELSAPRWEENPSFVLSMLRNYLNSEVPSPEIKIEEQKRIRQETTDFLFKKLSKSPVQKLLFRKLVERIQNLIVTRENLKTTWVRGISAMRVIYLEIAERFVKKGILQNRDDIFYLKMTEVSDIIAGTFEKEKLTALIEERRKERELYEHLDVPTVIVGSPPPIEELTHTIELEDKLEGMGVSHGAITGRARVIHDPTECSEFSEGDILVAPVTDPGWTPLFVTAGGLVMELGGTLSHGVIIAREYGIPAVVGVKNATKIIKTGQIITVDGNSGIVYIRGDFNESKS